MNIVEKKALNHVLRILRNFEFTPMYQSVAKDLEIEKIDPKRINMILGNLQTSYSNEYKKITEAKEWIEAILSENNTKEGN